VTLVTCYPFDFIGHAPKRFIVQAELTDAIETETQRR
jgi:sortase (surface protein transpeptidase)